MARKAKNSASAPDLLGGAPVIPRNPKPTAEAKETTSAGVFAVHRESFDDESRKYYANAVKPDPNGTIFDEYGIDGKCKDIPDILKAILCELVLARLSQK